VICELIWVLESVYDFPRDKVALVLDKILRTSQFRIENHQETWFSLREYQSGGDFADALIGITNRRFGCERTVTLDRKAARLPGFVAL
ncbi:MAG: type II toxin-antitoxin system VapC family toxin, partial [Candidatus Binataceae bacterium]